MTATVTMPAGSRARQPDEHPRTHNRYTVWSSYWRVVLTAVSGSDGLVIARDATGGDGRHRSGSGSWLDPLVVGCEVSGGGDSTPSADVAGEAEVVDRCGMLVRSHWLRGNIHISSNSLPSGSAP